MSDGFTTAMSSENQLQLATSHNFGAERQIGVRVFQQTVLVNSSFGRKDIGTANGLHARNHHSGELSDELTQRSQLRCINAKLTMILIAMHRQGHSHFFQRSVASSLTNSIDSALHNVGPFFDAGEGIGDCQAQIVMKMDSEQSTIQIWHAVLNRLDEIGGLARRQ